MKKTNHEEKVIQCTEKVMLRYCSDLISKHYTIVVSFKKLRQMKFLVKRQCSRPDVIPIGAMC